MVHSEIIFQLPAWLYSLGLPSASPDPLASAVDFPDPPGLEVALLPREAGAVKDKEGGERAVERRFDNWGGLPEPGA